MCLFSKRHEKNVFLGKRKAKKYLRNLNIENKTEQIDLLQKYVCGDLEEVLNKYSFEVIEVYVDGSIKHGLDLQVNLKKQNKNIGLDFFSEYYEVCFYLTGCTPEDVENSIVKYDYRDFDFETLLKIIESKINNS